MCPSKYNRHLKTIIAKNQIIHCANSCNNCYTETHTANKCRTHFSNYRICN